MADQGQTPQNTTQKYLKKDCLQALLEGLFPGQTEFNIRVRNSLMDFPVVYKAKFLAQLREDQWYFTAPRIVSAVSVKICLTSHDSNLPLTGKNSF